MSADPQLGSRDAVLPPGAPVDDPVDQEWELGPGTESSAGTGTPPAPAAAGTTTRRTPSAGRPGRPEPTRSRAVATVAAAWRQLTSMRTALLLLFLLAVAAVPGSLLPQRPVNPLRVQQYLQAHPRLGPFLDRLSGFDVFSAPWFSAVYVLLMVSLVGCVLPRLRLHVRSLFRQPPKAPAHPARLPSGTSWVTTASPEEAARTARSVLRSSRFRAVLGDPAGGATVAAEKGQLRETGNLLFHFSLIAVLVGVALGSLYGYSGSVLVPEGRTFTNTLVAYDAFTPGARVNQARLQRFSFRLDDFTASYRPSGEPASFAAHVAFRPQIGAPVAEHTIEVNHPLTIGQTKVYLTGHGYAPHFVLRDRTGRVLFDDYVPCAPRGTATEPIRSSCTVKVPDAGLPPAGRLQVPQQLAFRASLVADPAGGSAQLRNPELELSSFVGDLHLDEGIPQNVYSLDPSGLQPIRTTGAGGANQLVQLVRPDDPRGSTLTGLPDGLTLSVDGVRNWSVFAIKHDPGKGLVLAAAVLLLLGLVTSLTVRRRRVWVRATDDGGRTLVEFGGVARTGDLTAEFDELAGRLREALPPDEESAVSAAAALTTRQKR